MNLMLAKTHAVALDLYQNVHKQSKCGPGRRLTISHDKVRMTN